MCSFCCRALERPGTVSVGRRIEWIVSHDSGFQTCLIHIVCYISLRVLMLEARSTGVFRCLNTPGTGRQEGASELCPKAQMLRLAALCLLPSSLALCATTRLPRVPQSPQEMMQQAARAVSRGVAAGALRQTVKIVVPDDQRTYKVFGEVSAPGFGEIQGTSAPEDLDPWPGGLLQQYPIALDLGKQMLMQVTGASERGMSDQVLNSEDGCGLILAQGSTPSEDAACVLFAGTDQLDDLAKVGADGEKRSLAAAATHRPASPPRRPASAARLGGFVPRSASRQHRSLYLQLSPPLPHRSTRWPPEGCSASSTRSSGGSRTSACGRGARRRPLTSSKGTRWATRSRSLPAGARTSSWWGSEAAGAQLARPLLLPHSGPAA